MRSLLILPLLASASLEGIEWDTDAHVSLLQHQARKVLAEDEQVAEGEQIPGPPAHVQVKNCKACISRPRPDTVPAYFCGVNNACQLGAGAKVPIFDRCPHNRGASNQEECNALAGPVGGPPAPQPAAARPRPNAQALCAACAARSADGRAYAFCGSTGQCVLAADHTGPILRQVMENCPGRFGIAGDNGRSDTCEEELPADAAPPVPAPVAKQRVEEPPADADAEPPAVADAEPPAPVVAAPVPQELGQWNYEHPEQWRTVQGAGQCGGGRQSPIDVNRHARMPRAGSAVQADYKPTRLTALVNNGHTLLTEGQFGTLRTRRGVYTAQQIKFHFPSEHTFDGVNADGEMHIIHTLNANPNNLAVIAVPLKVGRPLSYQFDALHAIGLYNYPDDARLKPGERKALTSTLNLQEALKPQLKNDFYSYDGSLTAPPCTQTVQWFVSSVPMKVGWRMPTDFNLEFGKFGNNRPTQALNNRPVRVEKFLPTGAVFAPQPDPADDEPAENQAPAQDADNNDDVLTGDDAQAEADDNDADCDPTTWCKQQGLDFEPLLDEDEDPAVHSADLDEAKELCAAQEACVGIVHIEDNDVFLGAAELAPGGPLTGMFKPTQEAAEDEPPAPVDPDQAPEGPPADPDQAPEDPEEPPADAEAEA